MPLYTIGHSNHPIGKLVALLQQQGIRTLVDVRTSPYSRHNPHFNREPLDTALAEHDIRYVYAGDYLGGRPSDPTCYKHGSVPAEEGTDFLHEVDYPEVMKREWFVRGITRLLELAEEAPTTIMCSEENPAHCHRHHLIVKYLLQNHPALEVRHIRGDGVTFRAQTLLDSVDEPGSEQLSLF